MRDENVVYRIGPSDLVFLWEECRCCFYRKVVEHIQRPRTPMPKIFTIIDRQMKLALDRGRTEGVAGMPAGTMRYSEQWIESRPILLPGHATACVIRGRFDVLATLDDGTYAIVDLKTASVKDEHVALYRRQLWAYGYTVENSAPGKPSFKPVTALGLLVYEPGAFTHGRGVASLAGGLTWVNIPRDDEVFLTFMSQVLTVLELPSAPPPSASCEWCRWVSAA